jgi:hypothetical protein
MKRILFALALGAAAKAEFRQIDVTLFGMD